MLAGVAIPCGMILLMATSAQQLFERRTPLDCRLPRNI